jgi:pantoate--beta-alanine ligase
MIIFRSIKEFIDSNVEVESFVPTMGNLHKGHLSLIEEAKEKSNKLCVSIYVNENQFTDKEDYNNYPVTLDHDISKLELKNIDYLLIPKKEDIEKYSEAFNPQLEPKELTSDLCGKYRPGHFLAVMDIIHRFFQIIRPENIILGQKDFQQIQSIKKLVEICKYDINIITSPTIRNKSGLALSSRNALLSDEDKAFACDIYKSLLSAKDQYNNNVSLNEIANNTKEFFNESNVELEYFAIRDLKTLQPGNDSDLIALIAGFIGKVRLIDNIIIKSN